MRCGGMPSSVGPSSRTMGSGPPGEWGQYLQSMDGTQERGEEGQGGGWTLSRCGCGCESLPVGGGG